MKQIRGNRIMKSYNTTGKVVPDSRQFGMVFLYCLKHEKVAMRESSVC